MQFIVQISLYENVAYVVLKLQLLPLKKFRAGVMQLIPSENMKYTPARNFIGQKMKKREKQTTTTKYTDTMMQL